MKKHIYFLISILVLIFFGFHSQNFRIDASSDTLVAQNDKDFKYVSAWEYKANSNPKLHQEKLEFENIKLAERSYK